MLTLLIVFACGLLSASAYYSNESVATTTFNLNEANKNAWLSAVGRICIISAKPSTDRWF